MRWRVAAGIACLALAAFAVLLARDVWRVEKALKDGDARSEATHVERRSWEAAQAIPFGLAEKMLAAEDDVIYRDLAARAILLARNHIPGPVQGRQRATVEAALTRIEREDGNADRASQAALLTGVLVFADPEDPNRRTETPSEKAAARFRAAVLLDPTNDEAKRNLELMLQQEREQNRRGPRSSGGGSQPGAGGAGLAPAGGGY
jgi:hypothetical protein